MTLPNRALALALSLALLACGKSDANDDQSTSSSEAATATNKEAGLRVHVVLTGGAYSGSYDATPPGATCIDYAAAGADGVGIAYFSDPETVKSGIGQLDYGTNKIADARAGTKNFGFSIAFADSSNKGGPYSLHPDRGEGTGTTTLTGTGPRYTVKVTGKTTEGYGVDATLECLK